MSGPLQGIRILEIGHFVAAPFAARVLGDLGAEVIKIEPPGGDPVRQWGASVGGHGPWWSVHGRNKQCMTVNLKHPKAKKIVLDLAATSDVLLENFRPGHLDRFGLDEVTLRTAKPDLVITRISGYGQTGPGRDRAAFGVIGEAVGGLRYLTDHAPGVADLPPVRTGISLGDSVAGLYAVIGIMSALWRRDSEKSSASGKGAHIDVALTEAVLSLLEGVLPEYGTLGKIRQPTGGGIATTAPTNAYRTKSGRWVLIAANSDPLFERLCTMMALPELLEDSRFASNQARVAHTQALDAVIQNWTSQFDLAEVEHMLAEYDIPSSRIFDAADCAADEQFRARGMVQEITDPLLGKTLHPGVVPRFEENDAPIRWTGPAIGAQTDEILLGMVGFSEDKIAALRKEGVV
ncbi:MAG: CoA transferase [Caulobacterales bacterium]